MNYSAGHIIYKVTAVNKMFHLARALALGNTVRMALETLSNGHADTQYDNQVFIGDQISCKGRDSGALRHVDTLCS